MTSEGSLNKRREFIFIKLHTQPPTVMWFRMGRKLTLIPPLFTSVFVLGHHSWEAESWLSLLWGSVRHKGAPAEAQAVEPPRQGLYGAQGPAA